MTVNRNGAGLLYDIIEHATVRRNAYAVVVRDNLLKRNVRSLDADDLIAIYRRLNEILALISDARVISTRHGNVTLGDDKYANLANIREAMEQRIRQCCTEWMRQES